MTINYEFFYYFTFCGINRIIYIGLSRKSDFIKFAFPVFFKILLVHITYNHLPGV